MATSFTIITPFTTSGPAMSTVIGQGGVFLPVSLVPVLPRGWNGLSRAIRNKVYEHLLPTVKACYPAQGEEDAVSLETFRLYYAKYSTYFKIDGRMRAEVRDFVFSRENLGVALCPPCTRDMRAVRYFGLASFTTLMIEVSFVDQPLAAVLVSLLSRCRRLEYVHLLVCTCSACTASARLPAVAQETTEKLVAVCGRGIIEAMSRVKNITLEFHDQGGFDAFKDTIGSFVQHAWMNIKKQDDTSAERLIKKALFRAQTSLTLLSEGEEKKFTKNSFF